MSATPETPIIADGIVLEYLKSAGDAKVPAHREHLARLRRDDVAKPVIYVGTGTCGLGAGVARTLKALRAHLAAKRIDAEIVEVGCIGLCAFEPILDVQLPGRNRVSFQQVTEENVADIVDAVLAGNPPKENLLG
jgi:(2Fe-2S) ferredoxin